MLEILHCTGPLVRKVQYLLRRITVPPPSRRSPTAISIHRARAHGPGEILSSPATPQRCRHSACFCYIALGILLWACSTSQAADRIEVRGYTFPSWYNGHYGSSYARVSMDNLKNNGANWIEIVPTKYVSNRYAHDFHSTANTESDSNVRTAIRDAKARGLKVLLKPHVDGEDGSWRGTFEPSNVGAWFSGYQSLIIAYARIAQEEGCEMFSIGCEFVKLTGSPYRSYWTEVVSQTRKVYLGPITYAANSGSEAANLSFWDAVDIIGVDHYLPLTNLYNPTVDQLEAAWSAPFYDYGQKSFIDFYRGLSEHYGKHILFTEMGYPSYDGGNKTPWTASSSADPDSQEQVDCYTAFFNVVRKSFGSWFLGVHVWQWSVYPDPQSPKGHIVQGKPAQTVLRDNFASLGEADPQNPTSYCVYTDGLATDWTDWSWGSTVNLRNLSPALGSKSTLRAYDRAMKGSGSRSISVRYDQRSAGFSLRKGSAIGTNNYKYVKFWVHGGSGCLKTCTFQVQTADTGGGTWTVPFTVAPGFWKQITIPLSSLGNPSVIKRMNFQNPGGSAQSTIYYDDIRLVP